jgi:hypothetical protein
LPGLRLTARVRLLIVGVLALLATFWCCGGASLAAGPAAKVTVALSPASILADGSSESTVTATVTDASGTRVPGDTVMVFASDKGIAFSPNPARDNGDGTYTSTLTSSVVAGRPAVLALDGSLVSPPAFLTQMAVSTTSLAVATDGPVTITNLPVTNQVVTLVATVASSPSNVSPSGSVAFENGGNPIAGCAALPTPTPPNPTVTVTCGTSFAAATSPAQLTAVFTPTPGSLVKGSTSVAQSFPINKDATSTSVTMLGSEADVGRAMSFRAVVTPSQPGSLAPAGTVQFLDSGLAIGSCISQPLGPSSAATCTVSYTKLGAHLITASYGGDANFAGSTSGPVTVAVQALGTLKATMQWTFHYTPAYTQVRALVVDAVPPGATVLLKCRGHRCPFAKRVIVADKRKPCGPTGRHRCATHGVIDLAPRFRHRHLVPGVRITVDIIKAGWVGEYYRFTMRARHRPRVSFACTAPGTTSPGAPC